MVAYASGLRITCSILWSRGSETTRSDKPEARHYQTLNGIAFNVGNPHDVDRAASSLNAEVVNAVRGFENCPSSGEEAVKVRAINIIGMARASALSMLRRWERQVEANGPLPDAALRSASTGVSHRSDYECIA